MRRLAPWTQAFPSQVALDPAAARHRGRRIYSRDSNRFVALAFRCAVFPKLRALSTHHVFGRSNELLHWQPGWLATSQFGHRWIHDHPDEARAKGWLAPAGLWNVASEEIVMRIYSEELAAFYWVLQRAGIEPPTR